MLSSNNISQLCTWIFFSCFRASSFSLLAVSTWDSSDLRSPSIFLRALTAAERWRRSSSSSASNSRNYNTTIHACRDQYVCSSSTWCTTVTQITFTRSSIAFLQCLILNVISEALIDSEQQWWIAKVSLNTHTFTRKQNEPLPLSYYATVYNQKTLQR